MDPQANLEAALERARALVDDPSIEEDPRATELGELVIALHEWLKDGGFLPAEWGAAASINGVTRAQALALGMKLKEDDVTHVTRGGAGLPESYLYVTYANDPFVCGIDQEGRVSS